MTPTPPITARRKNLAAWILFWILISVAAALLLMYGPWMPHHTSLSYLWRGGGTFSGWMLCRGAVVYIYPSRLIQVYYVWPFIPPLLIVAAIILWRLLRKRRREQAPGFPVKSVQQESK